MSTLKPPRAVLDSTHIDHTARQDGVDRQAPYGLVPVLNLSPQRWAEWWRDRPRSSGEQIEAFSSALAIDCVGDALLLLQAGTSRAFSVIMVLTSILEC